MFEHQTDKQTDSLLVVNKAARAFTENEPLSENSVLFAIAECYHT